MMYRLDTAVPVVPVTVQAKYSVVPFCAVLVLYVRDALATPEMPMPFTSAVLTAVGDVPILLQAKRTTQGKPLKHPMSFALHHWH
jgi:hypothetical protein